MKLICKCGNIEELKTDKKLDYYDIRNCDDGTIILVCKKCSVVVFISFKNEQR